MIYWPKVDICLAIGHPMTYHLSMPYRKVSFAENEYYHIFNRGNRKQEIFRDDYDRARFLFLLLYFQSPKILTNAPRHAAAYLKNGNFRIRMSVIEEILRSRTLILSIFALMDNHFHLLVQALTDIGISNYMQKVLNGYTKYFNAKYSQTGHLFQGPFKAVHIKNNGQLLYTSAYIHRNPREIRGWKNKEHTYQWSSYTDYVKENRWEELLGQKVITEQFKNPTDYHK